MDFRFLIALRNIFGKKGERIFFIISLISIFLIALGVSSLIVVLGVMNGFERELKKRIVGTSPHIRITHIENYIENYEEILQRIEDLKITSIFPYIEQKAIFKGKTASGGIVLGLDKPEGIEISGENLKDENSILLGNELAFNLQANIGDSVSLITAKDLAMPKAFDFRVCGIFTSGMYDVDSSISYITLFSAKRIFGIEGVSGIGIKLSDVSKAEEVKERLCRMLPKELLIRTYNELNKSLFDAMRLERKVMAIILLIILLVSLFSLFSLLTITIIRKKREIGILRLLGAGKASIALIFLIEGGIIGFLGTTIGTSFGLLIGKLIPFLIKLPGDVYYISSLPFAISTHSILWISFSSFILSIIFSVYPALFASKISLSDALREE
ncbi:MAG: ABC transporter permease [bacterium]